MREKLGNAVKLVVTPDQPLGIILRGLLLAPVVHTRALVTAGKSFCQFAVWEHPHVTTPVEYTDVAHRIRWDPYFT